MVTDEKRRLQSQEARDGPHGAPREAEEFADEDRKAKERVDARNSLEAYVYTMKDRIGDDKDGRLADDKLESEEREGWRRRSSGWTTTGRPRRRATRREEAQEGRSRLRPRHHPRRVPEVPAARAAWTTTTTTSCIMGGACVFANDLLVKAQAADDEELRCNGPCVNNIRHGPSPFCYAPGLQWRHQTGWPAFAAASAAETSATVRGFGLLAGAARRSCCSRGLAAHVVSGLVFLARVPRVSRFPVLPLPAASRAVSHAIASPSLRRRRLRSVRHPQLKMDPEDFSDSEEEEQDDDVMLFILPALYLASTEIASPGRASTGAAKARDTSERIAAPGHTSKRIATARHTSTGTAAPDHASERIAIPGNMSKRTRNAKRGHASTGTESPGDKKKFRNMEWVCKVLEDDRGEGYDTLQVKPRVLQELSVYLRSNNLLQNTKGASVEEKVAMFIYMLSRNSSFHKLSKRFEYSTETIHRHIKSCFDAVTSLTSEFVKPVSTQSHSKISSDLRFGPYFENCIGAIDGIHVPMNISDSEAAPYRNREESISQNVMLACDFDLNFVYVSCGREGSASDAAVLYSAIESGFEVPGGKYYLVDGGYANTPSFLAPYIGVPYPKEEQEQSSFQPRDYMELFNLRHAQLHNHIKHAIGLLKMRFPILNVATGYRKDTQLKIPAAAVVLHNIFQRQSGDEEQSSNQTVPSLAHKTVALPSGDDTYANDVAALNSQSYMGDVLRDGIALQMWADYERDIHSSNLGAFVWNSENNQVV